jgi:hypothetical protein
MPIRAMRQTLADLNTNSEFTVGVRAIVLSCIGDRTLPAKMT